jgi:hypothetical protein
MKNENLGNLNRGFVVIAVLLLLGLPVTCRQVTSTPSESKATDTIVFEGTLEKLGPDPGIVSGILAVYRLAKYRVKRVCEGKYDAKEIVVDHLIFTSKEFEGININDRVCVRVRILDKVLVRYDAEGIRSPSDDVKTFYVAHEEIKITDWRQTCCDSQR